MGYALGLGYYLVLPLVFLDIDIDHGNNIDIEIKNNTIGKITKIDATRNNNILGVESEGTSNKVHSFFSSTSIYVLLCFICIFVIVNLWLQYEQYKHHIILANIRCGRQRRQFSEVITTTKKKKE